MDYDDYASVTISCPTCKCDQVFDHGWNIDGQFLDGAAAEAAVEGRLKKRFNCTFDCPCHTGIGLMPRLAVRVG